MPHTLKQKEASIRNWLGLRIKGSSINVPSHYMGFVSTRILTKEERHLIQDMNRARERLRRHWEENTAKLVKERKERKV